MISDGWRFEADHCTFNLEKGFEVEWMAMSEPFVVADIETTGPHAEIDEVVEFSALLVDPSGKVTAEFSQLVRIKQPVPLLITKLTGITQADVDQEGRPLADAVNAFLEFIGSRSVFIFHAPFDQTFLNIAARQIHKSFENPIHDVLPIAIITWPTLASHRIEALARHFDTELSGIRAIDCARATLAVLMKARELAYKQSEN
jgi:DNA polymerase-3 subunit epsilon